MSTILDALRKVEREREPTSGAVESPTLSPEVRRRRAFPVVPVLVCAVIGFTGGALLSWWLPNEKSEETAVLPAPPRAPDIAVPRAPVRARAKAAAPGPPAAVAKADVPPPADVAPPPAPVAPPPPATGAAAGNGGPAGVASAPTLAPASEPKAETPQVAAVTRDAVAGSEKESALEPSPFGAAREAAREGVHPPAAASVAVKRPTADAAPLVPPPSGGEHPGDRDVAALTPPAPPEAPPAETNVEPVPEPEPEAAPEPVFDTGRSPPGAPKVALSFLQWSVDPARRFAFISIDGAPSQRVREGEVAGGLTVAAITPTGVQFKREGTSFVIRPRH